MALLYASGVAGAIVLFMAVSWLGERTLEPRETITVTAAPTGVDMMLHVLLALAVVIVTARLLGAVFTFIHQPAVIGEVVGGIMLGPSLLGARVAGQPMRSSCRPRPRPSSA